MGFFILNVYKYNFQNKKFLKNIYLRHISNGLQIWNKPFQDEYKFQIQKYWKEKIHKINNFSAVNNKEKFYVLSMFPYPSGNLHMGHVRIYVISDTIARFYRLKGKNVIHPMGWDAFGLPAENAAIKNNIHPSKWIKQNIEHMREQLHELGCTFDADREVTTSDPAYYKWTQELFLKLYDEGLLYRKEKFVNWDPVDKTVLADEQIDKNNKSWRSGAVVQKRLLKQWFVKTTAFAKSLLEGLNNNTLKEWRDIILIQKHWIGDCTGTKIDFQIVTEIEGYPKTLTLWTDRPEYIENAKFVALSKSSCFATIENKNFSGSFIKLNAKAINPFTNKELPMYLTNKDIVKYVNFRNDHLGIPNLSETDAEFCRLTGIDYEKISNYTDQELQEKLSAILQIAKKRKIGGYLVGPKLEDWLISRQRYWGTPIPMVYCKNCGCQPVPRNQLPVLLPKVENFLINKGLQSANEWLNTTCPKCNEPATRETDTMDTFVDSSWYFMRYIDPKNEKEMFSTEKATNYLPVDLYIGGKEHATLHLYYSRFVSHFLHRLGLIPTPEPFKQLLVQGVVMGETYVTENGQYVEPSKIKQIDNKFVIEKTNESVYKQWEKMSKSKGNSIDPSKLLRTYSTDTIRLLIMANHAPTSTIHWSTSTIYGILRWEKRLWKIVSQFINARNELEVKGTQLEQDNEKLLKVETELNDNRNYYLHGVTFNIVDSQQISIAITKMQGLTNSLQTLQRKNPIETSREFERALAAQIIMLAPLAPHFASELWTGFASAPHRISDDILWDADVLEQPWPEVDPKYLVKVFLIENNNEIVVMRYPYQQLQAMNKDDLIKIFLDNEKFNNYIKDKRIKYVYLKNKSGGMSINLVTEKINISRVENLSG